MEEILATYRNGQIHLDIPVDWPDGTRIEIRPVAEMPVARRQPMPGVRQELLDALGDEESYGLDEALWPQTSEELAVLLAHMDAAQPLDLTQAEQAQIEEERLAEKDRQKVLTRQSWEESDKLFP